MTCFGFVEAERAQFPVSLLCRVVGVTRQGYYAWKRRGPSDRELADIDLAVRIRRVHEQTEGIYGAPRIQAELRLAHGVRVGKKRVARLMRQLGLKGADGRGGGPRTTIREAGRSSAPDLVDRDFTRAEPNRLWVCDIKYGPDRARLPLPRLRPKTSTAEESSAGQCATTSKQSSSSTRSAWQAHTRETAGVIAHSDHGSQYTSLAYGRPCQGVGNRSLHGQRRRPLGQRARRDILRQPRERTPQTRTLHHTRARTHAHLLVHRMLLQPPPTPLQPRHAQPHQLRTTTPNKGHRGLDPRCQPKRVNSNFQPTATSSPTPTTTTPSPGKRTSPAQTPPQQPPNQTQTPKRTVPMRTQPQPNNQNTWKTPPKPKAARSS